MQIAFLYCIIKFWIGMEKVGRDLVKFQYFSLSSYCTTYFDSNVIFCHANKTSQCHHITRYLWNSWQISITSISENTNRKHLNKLCVMLICWTNSNFSRLSSVKKSLVTNWILMNKQNKKISIFTFFYVTFCSLNAFRFFRDQFQAIEVR